MAFFIFYKSTKYRLNLCDRNRAESSVECPTLQDAVNQAQEALASDILPTSIERCSVGNDGAQWLTAWYPNDTSGVYSIRKKEIAASLEDFIKSNL
jgi:hypothetical protein